MRRSVHARTSGTLSSMLEEDPQSSPLCVGAGRKDERGVRGVDRSVARAEFSLGHQVIAHNSKDRARAGLPLGGTTKCTAVARLQPVSAAYDSGAARCGGRTPLPTLSSYFFLGYILQYCLQKGVSIMRRHQPGTYTYPRANINAGCKSLQQAPADRHS